MLSCHFAIIRHVRFLRKRGKNGFFAGVNQCDSPCIASADVHGKLHEEKDAFEDLHVDRVSRL